MKIGFYTAILSDLPIETVARWAATAGFTSLEIDVNGHVGDPACTPGVVETVRRQGLGVCALTYFGNLLASDSIQRGQIRSAVQATVDAAIASRVDLVVIFAGRDDTVSEDDNYRQLAEYLGPLAEHALRGQVRLAIENWPGPHKNYIATTPAGWARLFTLVPAPNLGLNFDPSHLIWQGIDYESALRAVADRVFLTHAKDTEICPERLQQVGYFGAGWWIYRLPGHGRIDWRRWLALLREVGFSGVLSVEHEDPAWGAVVGGTVSQRQEGLLEALRILRSAYSVTYRTGTGN
jgi:sugar phosphate isomerase/epimerase